MRDYDILIMVLKFAFRLNVILAYNLDFFPFYLNIKVLMLILDENTRIQFNQILNNISHKNHISYSSSLFFLDNLICGMYGPNVFWTKIPNNIPKNAQTKGIKLKV